jgi:hypothetical protein
MRILIFLLTVLLSCSKPENTGNLKNQPNINEQELANDEPAADGSNEITRGDYVKTEVNEINSSNLLVKPFVYQSEAGNQNLVLHFLESSRGERTLRKVAYKMADENYSFNIQYYYDLEGRIIFSELEKNGTNKDYALNATIVYTYDENVLEFQKKERVNGETKISTEFSESFFQETFEGILHFSNTNDLTKELNSKLVDKEFYIESREDYFDVGEGEIENADQAISSMEGKDYTQLNYNDIFLFIRNNELGQKATWRNNYTDKDPVFEIPLPKETYFKGAWANALLFEEHNSNGFTLHVYDITKKDFVFKSKISNMKITDDKQYLAFTRSVTPEEIGFNPFCNAEAGTNGIGYLELIHLSKDYAELKYGQVFCFSKFK